MSGSAIAPEASGRGEGRWARYVRFWDERETPEALALVRILFGACLVANVLEQLLNGDVIEVFAQVSWGGIFPMYGIGPVSIFRYLPPTAPVVYGVMLAQLVGGIALTIGLFPRFAALVCLVIQMTLWDRAPIMRFDSDNVFRVFLFLMVLSPSGAALSVDARWRGEGRAQIPCWPRRLILAQLTFLYVRTGIIKMGSSWSIADGWSALYYAVNLPGLARWPGGWAATVYPLTQVGTLVTGWFEVLFFLVPLGLYLARHPERGGRIRRILASRYLRYGFAFIGLCLHVGLVVLMNLGLFPFVMLSLYPCLLTPDEARGLVGRLWRRETPAAGSFHDGSTYHA